ncbi:ATPase, F1/V1/A1 complex, alpha/beta subunit [Tanacetum coccineum]
MDHLWKFLGGKRVGDNRIVNRNDHNVTSDELNVGSSVNISSSSGVKTANGLMSDGLNVGSSDELNSNEETGTNGEPCSGSKVSSPSFAVFKRKLISKRGFVFIKFSSGAGLEGVLEHGPWLIRSVPLISRKWTPIAELSQDELISVSVYVKLHGVLAFAFTTDGLSVIATRLGTPMMADRALSDNVVVFVPREQEVKMDHYHPKKQQFKPVKPKIARGVSTSTNTPVSNVFEVLGDLEDDGFTSPDHFDLLTKEDGKTILLNLHESDDDADVENGCDDTATPSTSVGNSPGGNT